jgi:hypothetical protein
MANKQASLIVPENESNIVESVYRHGKINPPYDRTERALLNDEECRILTAHWDALQVEFIDDPQGTVKRANRVVKETMTTLMKALLAEREKLVNEWHNNPQITTEDLCLAFRHCRSRFDRLMTL